MFGYLSFAFSSALIVLRVVALWDRNKVVTALASACWLATIGSYIYSAATARAFWNGDSCTAFDTERTKTGIFSTFVSDLVLLILMLVGLLRWKNARQTCGVWWFLCTQGLVWVALLTLAEVPPTVFIILNLNDPLNLMFQVLALIIMAVGASRIYRGLADHAGFNRYLVKEAASTEWLQEPANKPIAPSHQGCPAEGPYNPGGSVCHEWPALHDDWLGSGEV
ncbi:hypothetical protein BJV78DRAFT_461835 [Lactifluus subvellereus]|nr:hypothetical protein BJV78DRAFT_461835 [Lactifluus subvellereus]